MPRGAAPLALLTVLALGCDPSPEAAERRRVVAAIDAMREAPSRDPVRRRKLLDGLERQPATTPEAIRARDACASAYRLLFDGDDRAVALWRALADGGAPDPSSAEQLHAAEDAVAGARAAMPACELALDALRHPPRG